MEYRPKHPQPFSFSDALKFDHATITEEIARLQNSLQRLENTQHELRAHPDDPELAQALRENEAVIASQEERINMLSLALAEKGVVASGSHYDLKWAPSAEPLAPPSDATINELSETNDGGIVL
ncbi:hypothetical protein F5148DRAFT_1164688 [Russula earlei]|uniref:Uncharacterized protein n=1 Tax=Russula earlei TaxID=71964 RepID=A0ACC0ULM0_9AGAM|nr:hypothetical protein F5148DRAFT_1164688 [Russula earlei]